MNIPTTVLNEITSLKKLVKATYENDAMLLPLPTVSNDYDVMFARMAENKQAIGSKRKGCHILQRRFFIGLDLQRLHTQSQFLFIYALLGLNLTQESANDLILYARFIQRFPRFIRSGLQFSDIKSGRDMLSFWFESQEAKRIPRNVKLSTFYWREYDLLEDELNLHIR